MDGLYVRIVGRQVTLPPALVAKYGLRRGMRTPFSGLEIYGEGEGAVPQAEQANRGGEHDERAGQEGYTTLENGLTLSQSEILDFAGGQDNSPQDEP